MIDGPCPAVIRICKTQEAIIRVCCTRVLVDTASLDSYCNTISEHAQSLYVPVGVGVGVERGRIERIDRRREDG